MKKTWWALGYGFALLLGTLLPREAAAQVDAASSYRPIPVAMPFLNITPDARSGGLGDQGVASSADLYSQNWNAAKYVFMPSKYGVAYSYTPWLRELKKGINLHYVSGFYRFDDKQSVSASLRYFSMGSISSTNNDGDFLQSYTPNEYAIDVAYSRRLAANLTGSVTFRFLHSDIVGDAIVDGISGKKENSFAADIAIYYQRAFESGELGWGVSVSNIGPKVSYGDQSMKSNIPTNLRLGARYTFFLDEKNRLTTLGELGKLLVPTPDMVNGVNKNADKTVVDGMFSSLFDAPGGFSEEMKEFVYSLGLEYGFNQQIFGRAGYFHESFDKGNRQFFTLGVGAKYKMLNLDFSYLIPAKETTNSAYKNTYRLSLGVNF